MRVSHHRGGLMPSSSVLKKGNEARRLGREKDREKKGKVRRKFFFFQPNGGKKVRRTDKNVGVCKKEERQTSLLTSLCVYFRHFLLSSFLLLLLLLLPLFLPYDKKEKCAKRESKCKKIYMHPKIFFFFLIETSL